MNQTHQGARLRVVAGRPLTIHQQGKVLRDAFTLDVDPEDSDESLLVQFGEVIGWAAICVSLFAIAMVVIAMAVNFDRVLP